MKLNIYMGYDVEAGSEEGAILIFAETAKQAKKLSFKFLRSFFGTRWIDIRIKKLRDHEYLRKQMKKDTPHVIDSPKVCEICYYWTEGKLTDGLCENCKE